MSKIAEALAKAKEQTGHTTAPFLRGEAPVNSGELSATKIAALRKAKRARIFWMVLAPCSLLLTLFVLWSRWDEIFPATPTETISEPSAPPVAIASAKPSAPEPSQVIAPSSKVVIEAPVAVVLPTAEQVAAANGSTAAPAPVPSAIPARPEITLAVANLVFTAIMPGEKPRLIHRGRVVGVGERVEGEIVFAGVVNGSLVFNDSRGAVYTRRY